MTTLRDLKKAVDSVPENYLECEVIIGEGSTEAYLVMPSPEVKVNVSKDSLEKAVENAVAEEIKDMEAHCHDLEIENGNLKKWLKESKENLAKVEMDLEELKGSL
jgi:predicted RNase H-like nuclease (RuvC/YqgF family)